jgi:hypothetical protein
VTVISHAAAGPHSVLLFNVEYEIGSTIQLKANSTASGRGSATLHFQISNYRVTPFNGKSAKVGASAFSKNMRKS